MIEGWDIDDCLDELADDRASASDWIDFGRLYVAEFKPEHLLHKAE
ncbi:hypothetical protein SAMN05421835_123123 [Amycolatopsis sacchari]|uniref:Uncharacterized protein n=1 Tax=Amycolatopsis sacchari TaxID=115433 RepID=A0A1I4ACH9_9PSEU|nr:hypothetical protein [Amycolatopsis sacchari]SFK53880.1 hypothetical protein SAMN05421835_123123 [Amycolatopsis sacchari]